MASAASRRRSPAGAPDGFVLGDAWLDALRPEARLTRPGGPLVLDTDLRDVARADERLRDPETARLLAAAVDAMALSTEAHEARHALDDVDPAGRLRPHCSRSCLRAPAR